MRTIKDFLLLLLCVAVAYLLIVNYKSTKNELPVLKPSVEYGSLTFTSIEAYADHLYNETGYAPEYAYLIALTEFNAIPKSPLYIAIIND